MTDFTHAWQWPQWAVIAYLGIGIVTSAVRHWKNGTMPPLYKLAHPAGLVFLLAVGGFFS
jgi:hypothetical protein